MTKKFRYLTSGESHGICLNAIIEGVPAGFSIDEEYINGQLAKRQSGYGRGARMKLETDKVKIKSGVRFGKTTGAPVCLEIENKDFENWKIPMSVEAVDFDDINILRKVAEKSFTKPRPGHADYAGSKKYNLEDLRDVLERASARKTAIEVAVGAFAECILREFGIIGFSHVTQIYDVKLDIKSENATLLKEKSEKSEMRCADELITEMMKDRIDKAKTDGDTVGGKFEVIFGNLPVGLGSYAQWDRAFDGIIAQAVMSIPGVKAVEIGKGVEAAETLGSEMHDEIFAEKNYIYRKTNNAGGIEGGITNGEPLIVKGTMKPIPTMRKSLNTVDLLNNEQTQAHFERSDTCAVPACSVVAQARVATVLLSEFLEKFGGDSLQEIKRNYETK